jgi:hypothetical protein
MHDAPGPSALAAESANYGSSDGAPGAIPAEVLPPPKVASPKPVQPPAVARVKVGGVVQADKILNQVMPAYPPLARQTRIWSASKP